MKTVALDDFVALNDQLAALVRAGVPLDLGLEKQETEPARALEAINAVVARRVSEGASLTEALEGTHEDIPPSYRSRAQLGIRSGSLPSAWKTVADVAESVDESRGTVRLAFFYPLVVFLLAYVGLIGFCLFFFPTLEALYQSLQIQPGWGFRAVRALRDTLPYWVAVPPTILLLLVAFQFPGKWWKTGRDRLVSRLLAYFPGTSRVLYYEHCAALAQALSDLVAGGMPFEEALLVAAESCDDATLRAAALALAAALKQDRWPGEDSPLALRFPPFLRWALWSAPQRGRKLALAAAVYRQSGQRRAERLRTVAPLVASVILGGGITLLYALVLFLPLVEMLTSLALPEAAGF